MNNCFAAIDMGTNSFHLIIVRVKEDGSFKIVDREKEIIRLGSHEGENLSLISPEEFDAAINILRSFKKLAQFYHAKISAVATSAVREAKNKKEFIEAVFQSTGIRVEAIEGHKEAELIYRGAKKALSLNDKKALCIDIGGGSTEFIIGDNGNPAFAESIKIGAVRLSKKFFPNYELTSSSIDKCEKFIEDRINSNPNINFNKKFDLAIGSSGTIEAAAYMIHGMKKIKPPKSLNGFTFSYSELKQIKQIVLERRTTKERLTIPGMEFKRADIIPAGLMILDKAFELFKLKSMTVSEYALREGIILEIMENSVKVE